MKWQKWVGLCATANICYIHFGMQECSQHERLSRSIAMMTDLFQRLRGVFQGALTDPDETYLQLVHDRRVQDVIVVMLQVIEFKQLDKTMRQKAAVLLGFFIERQLDQFQPTLRLIFSLVTRFSVEKPIKVVLFRFIKMFMDKWSQNLDNLFERTLGLLVQKLQHIKTEEIDRSEPIECSLTHAAIELPFAFTFDYPNDENQLYSTLFFMGDVLIELDFPDEGYYLELVFLFRKINHLVLTQEVFASHPRRLADLLVFWLQITKRCVMEAEMKTVDYHLRPVYYAIASWTDLYEQLMMVLAFLSDSQAIPSKDIVVHDYLTMPPEIDSTAIIKAKVTAAEFFADLMDISQPVIGQLNFGRIVEPLKWSIYFTFKRVLTTKSDYPLMQQGRPLLDLLLSIINKGDFPFSPSEIFDFQKDIFIPLIELCLADLQEMYATDTINLIEDLDDCFEMQFRKTILSTLSKLMERTIQIHPECLDFLMKWAQYSVEFNQSLVFHTNEHFSVEILDSRPMSTSTAFVLFMMVNTTAFGFKDYLPIVQRLAFPSLLQKLTQYQKALFYLLLAYCADELFTEKDTEIAEAFIMSALEMPMSHALRFFALEFLRNLPIRMHSEAYVQHFIRIFHELGRHQYRWLVLFDLLKRIELFSPDFTVDFIMQLKMLVVSEGQILRRSKEDKQVSDTTEICYVLRVFEMIGNENKYCQRFPKVAYALWSVFELHEVIEQFLVEDYLVRLGSSLLEARIKLPANFQEIFMIFHTLFFACEFSDVSCFNFLYLVIEKAPKTSKITNLLESYLAESFYYFVHFPEKHERHNFITMSSICLVTQSFLIKYPGRISPEFIDQIKTGIQYIWIEIPQLVNYPYLQGRLMNLALAVNYYKGVPFEYPQMANVIACANKHCFDSYDTSFLLYVLTKLVRVMKTEQKQGIFILIIYLLREEKARLERFGKPMLKDYKQFHKIFFHVNFRIDNIQSPFQYASSLKSIFELDEPCYKQLLNSLPEEAVSEFNEIMAFDNISKMENQARQREEKRTGIKIEPKKEQGPIVSLKRDYAALLRTSVNEYGEEIDDDYGEKLTKRQVRSRVVASKQETEAFQKQLMMQLKKPWKE